MERYSQYNLIYINRMGTDRFDRTTYELIFTDDVEDADGAGWDLKPMSRFADFPNKRYMTKTMLIKTKTRFFIANDDDENDKLFSFCFYDVCDNVLALAWELNPKDKKLVFRFGEQYCDVESKLKKRKIYMFEETRDNFVEDDENEE